MWQNVEREFSELIGKTLTGIEVNEAKDEILFTVDDGTKYKLFHNQDCCENVNIEDIAGDLQDLIGSPLLMAEEVESENKTPEGISIPEDRGYDDSFTWTFYKLATVKGYVTIRWYGGSNGYYSESVDFEIVTE